jgi:tRNA (cytidine32/uridine32-2'-O)-methyltransferase
MSDKKIQNRLENVRIVLVETSHAGNIGSAARAMKTMGLNNLTLVEPCKFSPIKGDACAMASGAVDLLESASVVDTIASAIEDCSVVVGSSARARTMRWPGLTPSEAAATLIKAAEIGPVAMVFGRERTGLTNDELGHCHYHSCIDANPEYSSLNLAMAVQVFAYEIRQQALLDQEQKIIDTIHRDDVPATAGELNFLFERLETVLDKAEFLFQQDPQYMIRKIKRMIYRAQLEHKEINIVQGIFTSIENKINSLQTVVDENINPERNI